VAFLKTITATEVPDDVLVSQYKESGNLQMLSQLYQPYMDLVYGVCLKYFKNEERAKDAVINIFEELVHKLRKYEVSNFKPWLYQVAKNHCLMVLRSDKKNPRVAMDVSLMQNEDDVHLNGVLEKEEHFNHMYVCLDQLLPEQKRTVELFYLEGKCYNEIAEITGIEWNKVRSFIQNGRRNLKICMDKQTRSK
jgi:RNA polymerase sigma factor (sigma-70 family)